MPLDKIIHMLYNDLPTLLFPGPPSSPRVSLENSYPIIHGTDVTIYWRPVTVCGGLPDFHYNVYIRANGSSVYVRHNEQPLSDPECEVNTDSSEDFQPYTIQNLTANEFYSIVVVATNGADNDGPTLEDLDVVQDRFIVFIVATGETRLDSSSSDGQLVTNTLCSNCIGNPVLH